MQWLKLQVGLRHNKDFRRLSLAAKVAFIGALMAAADYEQGGLLTLRSGPLTASELAEDLFLSREKAALAVRELIHAGFLSEGANGVLSVAKWEEKTASAAALRVRKHREKQRLETLQGALHETLQETLPVTDHCNAYKEKEEDTDLPTPSVDKSTSVVGSARSSKTKPDTSWVEPLRSSARAIAKRAISTLSPDERHIVARYHCLEFANCTKTEASNKSKALQVAAAFASMGRSQHYGDMTVGEYVVYARKVHEQREKTPWFDPWLIRAVVEWEA